MLKPFILQFVAQLSTRISLGPDLCRNEEWLETVIRYTIEAFLGADELRRYPSWLRPLVSLYLPGPRRGLKVKGKDTVRWMDEVAKGRPFDVVISQLFLSVAALHTTSDLLTLAMFDLVAHPEVMDELREKVRRVIAVNGWQKTSLYKMKLMDSFLKESQRVNHPGKLSMNRKAIENVTLSDGTFIPKGASIACSVERMSDPTVDPEPEKLDASRFLRMRERPGEENSWQFVTTSEDHLAFGHGTHACPGRSFASNEAKIALCHLLLMYDWKLPDGVTKRPETKLSVRESRVFPTGTNRLTHALSQNHIHSRGVQTVIRMQMFSRTDYI
ncbi:Cytochrome P450 [Macrophomina phaseolina MS6]|uniref:Cytochrome P450 n=1 Tax=Macrophomina phaseolina (strain MS6) TaxID=1126212 RepID=K2QMW5_MACPH|nr:Cytochrome P450 [Macrophomina phaseolina MS6]